MLKALIIGADAVSPKYIFEHLELYPNISQLVQSGTSASYSAYVQKGYHGSYLSEMNWSSIYTGLSPKQHGILQTNKDGIRDTPEMSLLDAQNPFWKRLNGNGISVGMWAADCCVNPTEIDGYVVSAKYSMINGPVENRFADRELQICNKDKKILNCIPQNVPPRQYPKTLAQQGYDFNGLKEDRELAWKAINQYHFQDSIENFQQELDFYYQAMTATQKEYPVDVLYFYTPTTDLIAHCCMYNDNNDVLIKAYQVLDNFIGKMIAELQPETTVFLSDHGMVNFKDLVYSTNPEIQREAFSARDEVLWLKNGYIAFEAHNGALLFTAHALKGTFVISGKDIQHKKLDEMRTLDIYPTLLELFSIDVDDSREGYVQDIFTRPVKNQKKLLPKDIHYVSIALIQCQQPNVTDIILNELYIEHRFAKITVVGQEKYREIFLHNPRVENFIPYEEYREEMFEEVYCGIYNQTTEEMQHLRIK